MIAIPLTLLFLFVVPPQAGVIDPPSQQTLEEAKARAETYRQAAVHINELAGNIHSEADARAFVDAVAERFSDHRYEYWLAVSIRHRVARAEYTTISDPSRLIPEQRIVDVWNEYVLEIDAPEETLITLAEVHNLRDAMYTSSQFMWKKNRFQNLWMMPEIYAVGADGKVAAGCRAIEALKIFHDMSYSFRNVQSARDRVRKGVLVSDLVPRAQQDSTPRPQSVGSRLGGSQMENPVRSAEYQYVQGHGDRDYQRLLNRLFEELFPAD